MRNIIYAIIVILSFISLMCNPTNDNGRREPVAVQSPYTLVWQDEFDYKGFPDSTKWSYDIGDGCPALCGWGNDELQHYTRRLKNARVENGHLIIEVHKEDYEERKFTSARLVTRGKQDWKYGRFEIRAKLPLGKGIWSAIWMLHSDSSVYGVWPKSGEIDIMENVGYDPDTVVTAAHTGAYYFTIGTQKESRLYVPTNSEEFHTYVLEWDEDEYRIFVNDLQFFTFPNEGKGFMEWPFDQKFYLVMNIAYGGNWGGAMGLEEQKLPQRMEIDYVRVYQKRTDDNSN